MRQLAISERGHRAPKAINHMLKRPVESAVPLRALLQLSLRLGCKPFGEAWSELFDVGARYQSAITDGAPRGAENRQVPCMMPLQVEGLVAWSRLGRVAAQVLCRRAMIPT